MLYVVAAIAAVIVFFVARSVMRAVVLEKPCPRCGVVAKRQFENPKDPKSDATPCGSCIAYLRVEGDAMREEPLGDDVGAFPFRLTSEQYLPAVQRMTNRNSYKFAMPPMCAICGDTHASHHRVIDDGDHFGRDIGPLWSQKGHVLPQAGMAPSGSSDDDKKSDALSKLSAPVCAKHTENEDPFGHALKYSSGMLEFGSYRYYIAFCELNKIERAATKSR